MDTNYRLRELRESRDITQTKIAAMLNLTLAAYSRKEKGTRGFTIDEAKKLSKIFKVTFEELF